MRDDRTAPMGKPQPPRRGPAGDEQKTVFADQEGGTAPTIHVGDQPAPGWPAPGAGFVRATPADTPTPQPFQRPQPPFGPPGYPQPAAPTTDRTMLISERPTPVFAWLVMVEGPDRNSIGTVHSLRPDATTIGRVQGNQIVLRDETVSSQHARVRMEAREGQESAFVLYDMGSRNGIFVGDRQTYKESTNQTYRHELQDGDYLLIGETTLVFKKL